MSSQTPTGAERTNSFHPQALGSIQMPGLPIEIMAIPIQEFNGKFYFQLVFAVSGTPFHTSRISDHSEQRKQLQPSLLAHEPQVHKNRSVSRISNFLDFALSKARSHWNRGEVVTLWRSRDGHIHIYLKEENGTIFLQIAGYDEKLEIWWQDDADSSWYESATLRQEYPKWVRQCRQWIKERPENE